MQSNKYMYIDNLCIAEILLSWLHKELVLLYIYTKQRCYFPLNSGA